MPKKMMMKNGKMKKNMGLGVRGQKGPLKRSVGTMNKEGDSGYIVLGMNNRGGTNITGPR